MLNEKTRLILAVYVVVGAVQVTCEGLDATVLAAVAQVLLMPLLVLALLAERPGDRSRLVRLTLGALLASWGGDLLPRFLDGDPAFLAMVGCFLVAQVFYINAFRPYRQESILHTSRPWLAVYAVVVLGLIGICLPEAGVLAPAVVVYGLALGTMAVLATGPNRLTWLGGAFFLVSDGLIAIDAFSDLDLPAHDVSVMATYVVAQLLLLVGIVHRDRA